MSRLNCLHSSIASSVYRSCLRAFWLPLGAPLHSVREFVELAFAEVDIAVRWQRTGVNPRNTVLGNVISGT